MRTGRPEIRAAAWVFIGCVVLGLLGAVVWGLLAPAEHVQVITHDRGAPLTNESQHQFDAIAIFVGIAVFVGLLSAVAAWQWRSRRGPILYLGLLAGSVVGTVAMTVIGGVVARLHHPHVDAPKIDQIIAIAPSAVAMPFLIAQTLMASFVTLVLASISARDDLGVHRGEDTMTEQDPAESPVITSNS